MGRGYRNLHVRTAFNVFYISFSAYISWWFCRHFYAFKNAVKVARGYSKFNMKHFQENSYINWNNHIGWKLTSKANNNCKIIVYSSNYRRSKSELNTHLRFYADSFWHVYYLYITTFCNYWRNSGRHGERRAWAYNGCLGAPLITFLGIMSSRGPP